MIYYNFDFCKSKYTQTDTKKKPVLGEVTHENIYIKGIRSKLIKKIKKDVKKKSPRGIKYAAPKK